MRDTIDDAKTAAYILWENSCCDNDLNHWSCVEDIAYYFRNNRIRTLEQIGKLLRRNREGIIQPIASRIHTHISQGSDLDNWLMAEKLLDNHRWLTAVLEMANANLLNSPIL